MFQGHDADVIVKLLCKEMFREADPVSITEMINIMVRVLRPGYHQGEKSSSSHQQQHSNTLKNPTSNKPSTRFKIKST